MKNATGDGPCYLGLAAGLLFGCLASCGTQVILHRDRAARCELAVIALAPYDAFRSDMRDHPPHAGQLTFRAASAVRPWRRRREIILYPAAAREGRTLGPMHRSRGRDIAGLPSTSKAPAAIYAWRPGRVQDAGCGR